MNKVILMGRLTKDVEMRQTPNGVSLARFSIAVTRRFKNSTVNMTQILSTALHGVRQVNLSQDISKRAV